MSEELIKRLREQARDAELFYRGDYASLLREAAHALSSPAPASAPVPEGMTLVPTSALRWLHGEEGEFEPPADQRLFRGQVPTYWWRSEFRRRCEAAPSTPAARESGAQEAAFLDAMTYGQGFLLRSADGTETHIPVESVMQPIAQGGGVDAEKVMALVEEYFDAGVREGREGRDHDDEAGTAQRLHSQIRALLASPAGMGFSCAVCDGDGVCKGTGACNGAAIANQGEAQDGR